MDASFMLPTTHATANEPGGGVRVRDVPIFAEVAERGGRPQPYDLAWLRGALGRDAAHRAGGGTYRAPMHFGHHEPGVDRARAGHFEVTRLGLRLVEGEPKWTIFADLVFKDRTSYDLWRADYPYRSVEVSPDKANELNSLALLSSEAPYHRFPIASTFAALPGGGVAFLWRTDVKDPNAEGQPAAAPKGSPFEE